MKILFTRFPLESAWGGAEVQTMSLMRGLLAKSHAVAFLGSCPVLLGKCREENIPCVEFDIGPPPVTKWNALSFSWRARGMRQRLLGAIGSFRDLGAVVMLSLSEKILATEPLAKEGKRVLWIEHDRVGRWLTANPWLSNLRGAARHATTVCVSELSKQMYLDLGWPEERTVVIPNGIDLEKFQPPPPSPLPRRGRGDRGWGLGGEKGDGTLRLGCLARMTHDKGIDILIEAMKDLPNTSLTIVGTGREESALKRRAAGIPCITFVEQIDDLADFYRSVDVLVLPSREHDPFGLVAAEAMACGTAVIVTDACGIAGYLTDGVDAVIVKAGSAEELRQAIERMKNEEVRERIAAEGLRTAQRLFEAGAMVDRYERLLMS